MASTLYTITFPPNVHKIKNPLHCFHDLLDLDFPQWLSHQASWQTWSKLQQNWLKLHLRNVHSPYNQKPLTFPLCLTPRKQKNLISEHSERFSISHDHWDSRKKSQKNFNDHTSKESKWECFTLSDSFFFLYAFFWFDLNESRKTGKMTSASYSSMHYTKQTINPHQIIISSPDPKYAPREWFNRQQFLRERIESRNIHSIQSETLNSPWE